VGSINNKGVYVTRPDLPDIQDYIKYLELIWESGMLTNMGRFHKELEKALRDFLEVSNLLLIANGTQALQIALESYNLVGKEVITTPFTFAATTHAIKLCGATPVFCDICSDDFNINPELIQSHINERTAAILGVHVFGNPCDTDAIREIAEKYSLITIYDAAHAFGVRRKGKSILREGDISTVSFHATKVFSTVEGGGIVINDEKVGEKLSLMRNFGIKNENSILTVGTNAKMSELHAAYGLASLKSIESNKNRRRELYDQYCRKIVNIDGVYIAKYYDQGGNYSYCPVVLESELTARRDDIIYFMNKHHIFPRKYFYPLMSNTPVYNGLTTASSSKLPVANVIADSIICLPMYSQLNELDVDKVCQVLEDAIRDSQ